MAARPSSAAMPCRRYWSASRRRYRACAPSGLNKQAARPVAAGLQVVQLAARGADAGFACRVGEGHDAVGVADIEGVAEQRHAEGLVQAIEECFAEFGDAVAVGIAQERDAVGAVADRGGALHRAQHGVVEDRADAARHAQRLGRQHVAIGQHVDPARMLEAGREGVDLEPRRGNRRLPGGPASRGRHLQRRDSLALCSGDGGRAAEGGGLRAVAAMPEKDAIAPMKATSRAKMADRLMVSPRCIPCMGSACGLVPTIGRVYKWEGGDHRALMPIAKRGAALIRLPAPSPV